MRAHPAGPRHADQVVEPLPRPTPAPDGALDPSVWPSGVERSDDGSLRLHGVGLAELAARYGTPLMLLDENDFRSRARAFREAFAVDATGHRHDPPADVYYAGKALLTTTVARWVASEQLGLDIATGGELEVAVRAAFPSDRLLFHGSNKSSDELGRALDLGVGRVVVDSFDEITRVGALAAARGRRQAVLVRITVGVEAHTHEFIATAHEDQKFGFSVAGGAAAAAVAAVLDAPGLELVGIHSHIGSQIFDTSGFEIAAHRAVAFLAGVSARHGVDPAELNLGGGLGIAYVTSDDPVDIAAFAAGLRDIVRRECEAASLPVPRLAVEPGRAIVGPAGLTLYEVGTVKPVELDGGFTRHYVSVDGGMSDNLRTALYDADYTVTLASRWSSEPAVRCRVVGKHCEAGDVVVRDAWLPADVGPGDLLAVAATGAYCRAMASSYNYLGRPPIVASRLGAEPEVVLRRETIDDLLALDPGATVGVPTWEA